jgi:hypothetical protein
MQVLEKLMQHARQHAPEADSEQEFLQAYGPGSTCELFGRDRLDYDPYTDCELIPDPDDPRAPWLLICRDGFTEADRSARVEG